MHPIQAPPIAADFLLYPVAIVLNLDSTHKRDTVPTIGPDKVQAATTGGLVSCVMIATVSRATFSTDALVRRCGVYETFDNY